MPLAPHSRDTYTYRADTVLLTETALRDMSEADAVRLGFRLWLEAAFRRIRERSREGPDDT